MIEVLLIVIAVGVLVGAGALVYAATFLRDIMLRSDTLLNHLFALANWTSGIFEELKRHREVPAEVVSVLERMARSIKFIPNISGRLQKLHDNVHEFGKDTLYLRELATIYHRLEDIAKAVRKREDNAG